MASRLRESAYESRPLLSARRPSTLSRPSNGDNAKYGEYDGHDISPRNGIDLPRANPRAASGYSLLDDDHEIDSLEPLRPPPPPPATRQATGRRVSFARQPWYGCGSSNDNGGSDHGHGRFDNLPRSRASSNNDSYGYSYHDSTIDDDGDDEEAILSPTCSDSEDDPWSTDYTPTPLQASAPRAPRRPQMSRRSSSTTTRPRFLPSPAATTAIGVQLPRSTRAQQNPQRPRFRRNASGALPRMLDFGGSRRGRYAEGYVPLAEVAEEEHAVFSDSEEEGEGEIEGGKGGRGIAVADEGELEGEWRPMGWNRGAVRSSLLSSAVPAWMK